MNHGHFGLSSTIAASAIGTALLSYLLLPFGVVEFRGPAAFSDVWLRANEAGALYDNAPNVLAPTAWSPGLMLTGLLIALVGVLVLVILGRQPLDVDVARWMGATGGLVTVVGSAIAFLPAMFHVGTGFSTFMGTLMFTEFRSQFWAFSPVVIAIACLVASHHALKVMVRVTANRDQIRDRARLHADGARYALAFLAVVLLVPWSIGSLPDGVSDSLSIRRDGDATAPLFFSAQDVLGATPSELESGGRLRYGGEDDWNLLQLSLNMMQAAAWVALAVGLVGTMIGTAQSVGVSTGGLARGLTAITLLAWVAAAVFYLLSWAAFKPRSSDDLFLPGFLQILVLPVGLLGARLTWRTFQDDIPTDTTATAA